ncbi:reverse transcriptase [Holotrichia oblita]|uniref:Reverse transcriptase n=1 Tax=Holotrichia oblita TaxID=644536 RepID=A0ACB9TDD3_HOLOL|nr:reverse transcriptase [Holotrichia oblita]
MGVPMGSTLSPILAQYVMNELLVECLSRLSFEVPFLRKFVDDIICAVPFNGIDEIIGVFNTYNAHIQFTVEKESNRSVPFLDTRLIRTSNQQIILDWYQKETSSGRYIHYKSGHTMKTKINVILGLKNRIKKISYHSLLRDNLIKLKDTLIKNSYPEKLVNKLLYNDNSTNKTPDNLRDQITENKTCIYRSLPYMEGLTHKLIGIFKQLNIKIAVKYNNNLSTLFTPLKDKIKPMQRAGVVYNIPCSECPLQYVGQTGRNLYGRITSHKSDIKHGKSSCAVVGHVQESNHAMNFDAVTVLDQDSNTYKRTFLEMCHINAGNNLMNKQTDIQNLNTIYSYLLKIGNIEQIAGNTHKCFRHFASISLDLTKKVAIGVGVSTDDTVDASIDDRVDASTDGTVEETELLEENKAGAAGRTI